MDIELMLGSVLTSLFSIKTKIRDEAVIIQLENELHNFIIKNFGDESRLTLENIKKWAYKNKHVLTFMKNLGFSISVDFEYVQNKRIRFDSEYEVIESENLNNQDNENTESEIHEVNQENLPDIESKSGRLFFSVLGRTLELSQWNDKTDNENVSGSRCEYLMGCNISKNPASSIVLHSNNTKSGKSEKIIYILNKFVVINYFNVEEQFIYNAHLEKVTCLALSNKNIIASADFGNKKASVHVWELMKKETLKVFHHILSDPIEHMIFMNENKWITIGIVNKGSKIFIYDILSEGCIFSIDERRILTEITSFNDKCIVLCPERILLIDRIQKNEFVDFHRKATDIEESLGKATIIFLLGAEFRNFASKNSIIHKSLLEVENEESLKNKSLYVIGHCNGVISFWNENVNFFVLEPVVPDHSIKSITSNSIGIFVQIGNWGFSLRSSDFLTEIKRFSFSEFKLMRVPAAGIIRVIGFNNILYIFSDRMEIFKYKMSIQNNEKKVKIKSRLTRMKPIAYLGESRSKDNNSNIQVLVNNENTKIVFQYKNNEIVIFDVNEKDYVESLLFEFKVICFNAIINNKKSIMIAVGLLDKSMMLIDTSNNIFRRVSLTSEPVSIVISHTPNDKNKNNEIIVMDVKSEVIVYNELFSIYSIIQYASDAKEECLPFLDMECIEDLQILMLFNQRNNGLINNRMTGEKIEFGEIPPLLFVQQVNSYYYDQNFGRVQIIFDVNGKVIIGVGEVVVIASSIKKMTNGEYYVVRAGKGKIRNFIWLPSQQRLFVKQDQSIAIHLLNASNSVNDCNTDQEIERVDNKFKFHKNIICKFNNKGALIQNMFSKFIPRNSFSKIGFTESRMLGMQRDMRIMNQNPPKTMSYYLKLNYVYGFDSTNFQRCFQFIHKYSENVIITEKESTATKQNLNQANDSNSKNINNDEISSIKKYPYDFIHYQCEKEICFFSGRIGVVSSLSRVEQRFYEKHSGVITSLTVSQSKILVASSETSNYLLSCVHVWNSSSMETEIILQSSCVSSFVQLSFSAKDIYLAGIGINTSLIFIIEIWEVETGKKRAPFRLSFSPIYDFQFNNYKEEEFIIVQENSIKIFLIKGVIIQEESTYKSDNMITAVHHFYHILGNETEVDYIFGNQHGTLGVVTYGHFEEIVKDAHKGEITNIKITDSLKSNLIIVTSGKDNFINFWSSRLSILKKCELSTIYLENPLFDISNKFYITGLDIYACSAKEKINQRAQEETKLSISILATTSMNEVFNINLSNQYRGLETKFDSSEFKFEDENTNETTAIREIQTITDITTDHKLLFSCHPNSSTHNLNGIKGVIITDKEIVASINNTNTIIFWNLVSRETLLLYQLNQDACQMDFNLKQKKLILLLKNNSLLILSIVIEKEMQNNKEKIKIKIIQNELLQIDIPGNPVEMRVFEEIYDEESNDSFHEEDTITENDENILLAVYICLEMNNNTFRLRKDPEILIKISILIKNKNEIKLQRQSFLRFSLLKEQGGKNFEEISYYNFFKISNIIFWSHLNGVLNEISNQVIENDAWISFNLELVNDNSTINFLIASTTDLDLDFSSKPKFISVESSPFPSEIQISHFYDNSEQNKKKGEFMTYKDIAVKVISFESGMLGVLTKGGYLVISPNYLLNNKILDLRDKAPIVKTYPLHFSPLNTIINYNKNNQKLNFISLAEKESWFYDWEIVFKQNDSFAKISNQTIGLIKDVVIDNELNADWLNRRDHYFKRESTIINLKNTLRKNKQNSSFIKCKLRRVIGRKSWDRKSNIFLTANSHLIYSAGSVICLTPLSRKMLLSDKLLSNRQEFIMLEDQMPNSHVCSLISTISLDSKKREIAIGTNEISSKIYFWDIGSKYFKDVLNLYQAREVKQIIYSSNDSTLLALCLTSKDTQMIYLIERESRFSLSRKPVIIALFEEEFSAIPRITLMLFIPNKKYSFYTFGIESVIRWEYREEILIGKEFFLRPMNKSVNNKQLVILCAAYLDLKFFITGLNSGCINFWLDDNLIDCQWVAEGIPVQVIATHPSFSTRYATGGADGIVYLWEISHEKNTINYVMEKTTQFSLSSSIQSLVFLEEFLICGLRTGEINYLTFPDLSNGKSKDLVVVTNENILCQLSANDQNPPFKADLNYNSRLVFSSTNEGLLSVYSISSLHSDLKINFNKELINLIIMKTRSYVLMIFVQEVIILEIEEVNGIPVEMKRSKLIMNNVLNTNDELEIKDFKLSKDESKIGIVYRLKNIKGDSFKIGLFTFDLVKLSIDSLPILYDTNASINFIDFSFDCLWMLICFDGGQVSYIKIQKSGKSISGDQPPRNTYFAHEGVQFSEEKRKLSSFYSEELSYFPVLRYSDEYVIILDQYGILQVFKTEEDYYPVFMSSQHLNKAKIATLSNDHRFLLTSSETDRCLFLWEIIEVHKGNNQDLDKTYIN